MHKICATIIAATMAMIFATAADAAEYIHLNAKSGDWGRQFVQWVQRFKPTPDSVTAGISGDEIHAYLIPGTFAGTYSFIRMKHPPDGPQVALRAIVDGGTGKIIGFIGENAYVLTWTKPPS